MRKWRNILALVLALVLCMACAGPAWAAKSSGKKAKRMTVVPQPTMADSVNKLNWTLFDAMTADKSSGNKSLFYSPYSIESALALADAGAAGDTKTQMEKVMGITSLDDFLKDYNAYRTKKQPDSAKLTTANGVWINTDQLGKNTLKDSYLKNVQGNMGAEVRSEPFTARTADEISRWVKKTTDGFISDYKPIVSDQTVVDLINAIYFYGEWAIPFEANATYKENFTGADGKKHSVDMMHQNEGFFRYYANKQFRGLELPYRNSDMVMDLVIPTSSSTLDAGAQWAKLSAAQRNSFLKSLDKVETEPVASLVLPKFTFDNTLNNLPDILAKAGMSDAFDSSKANFDNMAHGLYISDIQHRAKIQVDEEGSKAAAVTEIAMEKAMLMPQSSITFRCDRPFLYFIRDKSNGMILFTGMVNSLK